MSGAGQDASARVFISYSTTDRALVDSLKERLKQAGVDVWLDHEQLTPDTLDWQAAIRNGIDQATHLIYAASEAAAKSRYVVHELEMARGKNKRVICFWVRDAEWYDCTPMGWFSAQRIDGRGARFNTDVAELLAALGQVTPEPPAPQPARPALQPAVPPATRYPLPKVSARLTSLGFRGINVSGTPAIVPPLVIIPSTTFLMGSDKAEDPQARGDEMPQHRVEEVARFKIAKYPVTVAEYALAVEARAVREPPNGGDVSWRTQQYCPDHPVVCISCDDAAAYIAWLIRATRHRGWRLPTEEEWEKAARWDQRHGVSRIYPWGDVFDKNRCNVLESGIRTTSSVGSYPSNDAPRSGASPYGVEEMAGNVWEWTSSLYQLYPNTQGDFHVGARSGDTMSLRGGSWANPASDARAACRNNYEMWTFGYSVGFRLAVSPQIGS